MGTSKAYGGLKGNPNWGALSRTVSLSISNSGTSQKSYGNVMSKLSAYLGGSNRLSYIDSKSGGSSGIRVASKLGAFISQIQSEGFSTALNYFTDGSTIDDANLAINLVLSKCSEKAGLLDDVAANSAMRHFLEDICAEAETVDELGGKFQDAIKEYGQEELIIRYFAYYLYEHLCTWFYEKLIKSKGLRETDMFYRDIKEYIFEITKSISLHRDLRQVDWRSDNGKQLVDSIFKETLKAFEGYES